MELTTDEDIVKQFAMYKTGVDFDAPPPAAAYEGGPAVTQRDQPLAMRGVVFSSGHFAVCLAEVAYVERVEEGTDSPNEEGDEGNG